MDYVLLSFVRPNSAQVPSGRFTLSTREGYGRLDAFATVRFLLFPQQSAKFPFTAPVSVPHLWGTSRKKWLHWNSNTNSALQRNIAQAVGMGALAGKGGVGRGSEYSRHGRFQMETGGPALFRRLAGIRRRSRA